MTLLVTQPVVESKRIFPKSTSKLGMNDMSKIYLSGLISVKNIKMVHRGQVGHGKDETRRGLCLF